LAVLNSKLFNHSNVNDVQDKVPVSDRQKNKKTKKKRKKAMVKSATEKKDDRQSRMSKKKVKVQVMHERKMDRRAKRDANKAEKVGQALSMSNGNNGGDSKRGITYQMKKNRGLAQRRAKINRNPRLKLRNKFAKAKKKRDRMVRPVKESQYNSASYNGEAHGINIRVVRSVSLAD
jgi:Sas10 C-terminal domain